LSKLEKHDAFMGRNVRGRVIGTPSKAIPLLGKLLKRDVQYLVIFNMPVEEEMATMRLTIEVPA
jgi:hypothetical protein